MAISSVTGKTARLIGGASRKLLFHPAEAVLLCRMAVWVGILSLATRALPLPRALSIVAGSRRQVKQPAKSEVTGRLARAIDQLLSIDLLIFKPICWKRAAILQRYLSLNGINSRIVFGVKNDSTGNVSGHAWLESNGQIILETNPPDYVVTYSFPPDANHPHQITPITQTQLDQLS